MKSIFKHSVESCIFEGVGNHLFADCLRLSILSHKERPRKVDLLWICNRTNPNQIRRSYDLSVSESCSNDHRSQPLRDQARKRC